MSKRVPVAVKTRRWVPRLCLLLLLGVALLTFDHSLEELKALEPPLNPSYNELFQKEGRSLWAIQDSEGECVAVIAGGWKKLKSGGEIVRFHLKVNQTEDFTIKGMVSEYKVLKAAEIVTPRSTIYFRQGRWSPEITKEPILLVDTVDDRKILRLPAHLARDLTKYLTEFSTVGYRLKPLEMKEFIACKRKVESQTT